MKVGFIGLGRMGQGLAGRLLGGGHDLTVYNRTAEKAAELVKGGARLASSIAGVCEGREVVITMVTDDAALREVTLGARGIRESLSAGAIHLAMGTHSVAEIQRIAAVHTESNQLFVSAPVMGRPDLAASGQVGIVAAGPQPAVEKCGPLFQLMGRRTFLAGAKAEHAAITKLANNFMLGCALQAMSEGFSLVRKYGVVPQVFYEVMTESLFAAPAYKVYGKIIVDEAYDKVGFTTLLGLKDFGLIMAAAESARVPLPSANAFRDRLLSAIAHGDGEKDWASVAREQARSSGLESSIMDVGGPSDGPVKKASEAGVPSVGRTVGPTSIKVGFIGLGRMGKGMAQRVHDAGHDLAVYDVFPQATAEFAAAGVRVASSVADLCKDREVVITMLAEDAAVHDVAMGPAGMCASLPSGAIHMASGTYGIATIRALEAAHANANQILIAVPVLGRPDLAASGQLGIVPAGPDAALKRCEPLFQAVSRRIFYAGPKPESASAIKLANNAVLGCAITALGEGFSLVRKYGVDAQVLYDVMTEGLFAGAPAYVGYGKTMVEGTYDRVGSPVTIGMKDANLIAAAANLEHVPMPSHDVYIERLLGAIAHGDGNLDQAALAREQARAAGLL